jgi:hypothetical protein
MRAFAMSALAIEQSTNEEIEPFLIFTEEQAGVLERKPHIPPSTAMNRLIEHFEADRTDGRARCDARWRGVVRSRIRLRFGIHRARQPARLPVVALEC